MSLFSVSTIQFIFVTLLGFVGALFALMVVGISVFKFDPIATILPILFPSLVIRVLQIMEAKRPSVSEGSDKP